MEVTVADTKAVLSTDLTRRSRWAEEMIDAVVAEGLARERVEAILAEARAWTEIEADSEVVRLENEVAREKAARYTGEGFDQDSYAREAELMEARNRRIFELIGRRRESIGFGDITEIGRLGSRLVNARNLGSLFARYRELDRRMEELEGILEAMAIGWDDHVQQEVDRARGK